MKQLAVSGAFHTPLMKPAENAFKETLDKIDIQMPKYDLYSNVTGEKYTSTEEIKRSVLFVSIFSHENVILWASWSLVDSLQSS